MLMATKSRVAVVVALAFVAVWGLARIEQRVEAESGAPMQGTQVSTSLDRQPPGKVFRVGLSSADTAQITTAELLAATNASPEFDNSGGKQTISVTAFATNASATITVFLVGYWKDTPTGATSATGFKVGPDVTFTAPATAPRDPSGNYVPPTYSFDSMGCRYLKLRVRTGASAGTFAFGVGSQ